MNILRRNYTERVDDRWSSLHSKQPQVQMLESWVSTAESTFNMLSKLWLSSRAKDVRCVCFRRTTPCADAKKFMLTRFCSALSFGVNNNLTLARNESGGQTLRQRDCSVGKQCRIAFCYGAHVAGSETTGETVQATKIRGQVRPEGITPG